MCVKPPVLLISHCSLHTSPSVTLPYTLTPTQDRWRTDPPPDTRLQGTVLLIWSDLSLLITTTVHHLGLTLLPVMPLASPRPCPLSVASLIGPSGLSKW